ncbi:MAG TPA: hypothetical protein VLG76_07545 [Rhabdochlamydiaceae bacterium]|nr:hypothetical protein [Rhabdochlamydiaceae bacterium]
MSKTISEKKLLVYSAYSQTIESIQHYNSVQATYKTFASTWLLATFIGVGHTLTPSEISLNFPPLLAAAFICLASATGIFLIWYLDLIVCEQAIAATVFEGLEIEKKHTWLPSYYHNVNQIAGFLNYIYLKAIFYLGCFAILFFSMGACFFFYFSARSMLLICLIPILTLGLILGISLLLIKVMKKTDPYLRLHYLKGKNLV